MKLTPAMIKVLQSADTDGRLSADGVTRSTIKAVVARGLAMWVPHTRYILGTDLVITDAGRSAAKES